MFSAFDTRLTIANLVDKPHTLSIFYRDPGRREPLQVLSSPDVAEIIARLGGASNEGLHFTYGDIVAILQKMAVNKTINTAFVLQTVPGMDRPVQTAPTMASQQGRPQNDASSNSGSGTSLPDMKLPTVPKEVQEEMDKRKAEEALRLKKENAGIISNGSKQPATTGTNPPDDRFDIRNIEKKELSGTPR